MKYRVVITIFLSLFSIFPITVFASDEYSVSWTLINSFNPSTDLGDPLPPHKINKIFIDNNIVYMAIGENGLATIEVPHVPIARKWKRIPEQCSESSVKNVVVANNVVYVIMNLEGHPFIEDQLVLLDPSDLSVIGEYNSSNQNLCGLDVAGNMVYLTVSSFSHFNHHLIILNASDPAKLTKVGECEFSESNLIGSDIPQIDVVDDVAYIAGGRGKLHILSVKNSSQPMEIGNFSTPNWAINVEVVDEIAYITNWEDGLVVLNVSDPTNPIELNQYRSTGDWFCLLSICESVAYITYVARHYENETITGKGLIALNVTDPNNLRELGRYTNLNTEYDIGDIVAIENIVYLADNAEGAPMLKSLRVTPVPQSTSSTTSYISSSQSTSSLTTPSMQSSSKSSILYSRLPFLPDIFIPIGLVIVISGTSLFYLIMKKSSKRKKFINYAKKAKELVQTLEEEA